MNKIEQWDSLYPSAAFMITSNRDSFAWPHSAGYCSVYCYSFGESTIELPNKVIELEANQFCSFFVKAKAPKFTVSDELFIVIRLGYKSQNIQGDVEEKGRLIYVDGCSDSLLVYPSRLGDPSLNHLHFPKGINQTFHTHPSIRMGCVIRGEGVSDYYDQNGMLRDMKLTSGTIFCLEENQKHRFRTENRSMDIVVYHPDSLVGPTDENHPMKNGTFFTK
jgi:hypothetical protein